MKELRPSSRNEGRRMKTKFSRIISIAALAATGSHQALAQGGWFECIDPENTQPRTIPYGSIGRANILMAARTGVGGQVTYGGTNGP